MIEIINLGPDCVLTAILQKHNILKQKSPFDEVITSVDSLINCINDKFAHFTDENYFTLYFDKESPINKYGIVLAHNFPIVPFNYGTLSLNRLIDKTNELTQLKLANPTHAYEHYTKKQENMIMDPDWRILESRGLNQCKEKYTRRINRFSQMMNSNDKVYLFRCVHNPAEAIAIKNSLLNNYSNRNFKLIYVVRTSEKKNYKYETNDELLIGYHYNMSSGTELEKNFWHEVFCDINLKDTYFKNLLKNIKKNDYQNNFKCLINPLSIYYLSDHYYGNEINQKYLEKFPISKSNDLRRNNNIDTIKDYQIIAVQGGPDDATDWTYNYYYDFCENILPSINKKIILITGHYSLCHYLNYDKYFKIIVENKNVLFWFVQNYGMVREHLHYDKIKAFPFGLCTHPDNMNAYVDVLIDTYQNKINNNAANLLNENKKIKLIDHLYLSMSWTGRQIFPKKNKMSPTEFYRNVSKTKFLLSPCGDRWDCYRHYECIGLNAIPICHKGSLRKLFNESMHYVYKDNHIDNVNGEDDNGDNDVYKLQKMVDLLDNNSLTEQMYNIPNKDLITTEYWENYIKTIVNEYINKEIL